MDDPLVIEWRAKPRVPLHRPIGDARAPLGEARNGASASARITASCRARSSGIPVTAGSGGRRGASAHGRSPFGDDLLAGDVSRLGDRPGSACNPPDTTPAGSRSCTTRSRSQSMCDSMRWVACGSPAEDHPDVLGRSADPDERETVEQPDSYVMTNPDVRARQLVREVLGPSLEVIGC